MALRIEAPEISTEGGGWSEEPSLVLISSWTETSSVVSSWIDFYLISDFVDVVCGTQLKTTVSTSNNAKAPTQLANCLVNTIVILASDPVQPKVLELLL